MVSVGEPSMMVREMRHCNQFRLTLVQHRQFSMTHRFGDCFGEPLRTMDIPRVALSRSPLERRTAEVPVIRTIYGIQVQEILLIVDTGYNSTKHEERTGCDNCQVPNYLGRATRYQQRAPALLVSGWWAILRRRESDLPSACENS